MTQSTPHRQETPVTPLTLHHLREVGDPLRADHLREVADPRQADHHQYLPAVQRRREETDLFLTHIVRQWFRYKPHPPGSKQVNGFNCIHRCTGGNVGK